MNYSLLWRSGGGDTQPALPECCQGYENTSGMRWGMAGIRSTFGLKPRKFLLHAAARCTLIDTPNFQLWFQETRSITVEGRGGWPLIVFISRKWKERVTNLHTTHPSYIISHTLTEQVSLRALNLSVYLNQAAIKYLEYFPLSFNNSQLANTAIISA